MFFFFKLILIINLHFRWEKTILWFESWPWYSDITATWIQSRVLYDIPFTSAKLRKFAVVVVRFISISEHIKSPRGFDKIRNAKLCSQIFLGKTCKIVVVINDSYRQYRYTYIYVYGRNWWKKRRNAFFSINWWKDLIVHEIATILVLLQAIHLYAHNPDRLLYFA